MELFDNEVLNKKIEKRIIEDIKYRRKYDFDTGEQYYEKILDFSDSIESYFDEEEYDYVLKYMSSNGIIVEGTYTALLSDYNNYRCVNSSFLVSESFQKNTIIKNNKTMLKEYCNELDSEKRNELLKKIALSNFEYLYKIVSKFSKTTGICIDELIGSGYEGLVYSIKNYDSDKKNFSMYMKRNIERFVLFGIAEYYGFDNDRTYKILNKYKEIVEEKVDNKGDSFQKLSEEVLKECIKDNPEKQYDLIAKVTYNLPACIDDMDIESKTSDLDKFVSEDGKEEIRDKIYKALDDLRNLDDYYYFDEAYYYHDRRIIEKLYGLNGGKQKTLSEVAEEYGVTPQAIARTRDKVQKKLTMVLKKN